MQLEKRKIIIIILIGLAVPAWVIWKNIFPHFEYKFKMDQDNRQRISEKNIDGKRYLVFPVDVLDTKGDYLFDKITLQVKFAQKVTQPLEIKATDGQEVFLYPVDQEINTNQALEKYLHFENPSSYINGSIFAYGESAYFISRGQYLPIFSADVFERSGFDWGKVVPAESNALVNLREGEKFSFYTPHPDGTIIQTGDDKFCLVWEQKLLPVNKSLLYQVWPNFNWAEIEKNKELFGKCEIGKLGKNVDCQFQDTLKRQGSTYLFEISDKKTPIKEVRIVLKTSLTKDSQSTFALFIQRIKNELVLKYGKRL